MSHGLTIAATQYLRVRAQISGSGPSTVRIRAWLDGTAEPTTWTFSQPLTAPELQAAGNVGIRTLISAGAVVATFTVSMDDLLVSHLRDTQTRTVTYAYDGLQRLTSAVESGFSTNIYAYGYDTRGNRLTATGQPTVSSNAANQVVGWTYDAAGNLLSDPARGAARSRGADARARPRWALAR